MNWFQESACDNVAQMKDVIEGGYWRWLFASTNTFGIGIWSLIVIASSTTGQNLSMPFTQTELGFGHYSAYISIPVYACVCVCAGVFVEGGGMGIRCRVCLISGLGVTGEILLFR